MTLTLRIENYDRLDDGGPIQLVLTEGGASVGRGAAMDWVLPDPAKHISSHHFDISFENGAYWLRDVSRNGTYLQGQDTRLDRPHCLAEGDQIKVGQYLIGVAIAATAQQSSVSEPPRSALQTPKAFDRPTEYGVGVSHPPFVAPLEGRAGSAGLSHPPFVAPPGSDPDEARLPDKDNVSQTPPPAGAIGTRHSLGRGGPRDAAGQAVLDAFCRGAGINPMAAAHVDPENLAELLGLSVRNVVDEVIAMLRERASVKQFAQVENRTMRAVAGNNPMKFLSSPEQAIEALLLQPREGFMTAPEGFDDALKDLRRHQAAVFAALEPALASVLKGLSPDDISARQNAAGLLGSGKGKHWDLYVRRWSEKAEGNGSGMLDAFLSAFAKAYADATRTLPDD